MPKARVLTALLLLAGFLAVLFLLPFPGWMVFCSLAAGVGAMEWGGLLKLSRRSQWAYAFSGALITAVLGWVLFDATTGMLRQASMLAFILALAGVFWVVAVPFWLKAKWPTGSIRYGIVTGGVVLVPSCLALMQLRAFNPLFLLAVMASIWAADIAAYACGRRFGRHKLAPTISPGKTWEGALGAIGGVLVYGLIIAAAAGRMPTTPGAWILFVAGMVALTGVSILGDLFESLAKRQAGVKDSGTILPGHGGALDRIDSLTSTLPLVGIAVLIWEGQV